MMLLLILNKRDKMIFNKQDVRRPTVLVLGGRGFIGRHVVKYVQQLGGNVIVGSRSVSDGISDDIERIDVRRIRLHDLDSVEKCHEHLKDIDIVINTVGILRQRQGESYKQVHFLAVKYLAKACKNLAIRFVHLSALALDNELTSRFSITKKQGEDAIIASHGDYAIVRSSLVDGEQGFGAEWFRKLAQWPIHMTPKNATGKFAPINVNDLGEAIARVALEKDKHEANLYEFGGNQAMDVLDYLSALRQPDRVKPLRFKAPSIVVRIMSHILDLCHLTPLSFGHYELLQFENLPSEQHLALVLGRQPRKVGYKQTSSYAGVLNVL